MSSPEEPVWEIEPHTKAKHEILRRYLQGWFPIMTSFSRKVIYLDGFAGPGIYRSGEEGSPIIAIRCLMEHKLRERIIRKNNQVIFVFIEKDANRKRILEENIRERFPNLPENVEVHVINAEFEPTMKDILDDLEERGAKLAPTFAFLDPFGFSGLPMEIISRFMSYRYCEVLITFMTGFVNRFVNADDAREVIFDELFATREWRKVREYDSPEKRRNFIIDLYRKQLRLVGNARFVRSFEMVGKHNQVIYDLVFATNGLKGLKVMKEAMWTVDPRGTYRFSDTTDVNQKYLLDFTDKKHWISDAADMVFRAFKGRTATIDEIEEYVIIETPYLFRKEILKYLELQSKIINVSERKRRLTFPDECVITFSNWFLFKNK